MISIAEPDAVVLHELSARNLEKGRITNAAACPWGTPVHRSQTKATHRDLTACPGGMCATHHFPARVRPRRHSSCSSNPSPWWIPLPSHLFSPSLPPPPPFDGTGLPLRSRYRTHGQDRPGLPGSLASTASHSLRVRIVRNDVTMDTFRSGRRGRLKTAPCGADSADAGARGAGERER